MSDFMRFFDSNMGPKLGVRASTFRAVLREAMHQEVQTIVETGSLRKEDNWAGDGQSTLIWDAYKRFRGGKFTTIDLSKEAIELVNKLCPTSGAICADSVPTLDKMTGNIDLLYLDSFDLNLTLPHPAAMHCMFEFCAALPNLRSGSIVFIDDTPMNDQGIIGGKGSYVAQYFKHLGVLPFTSGYQAAWLVP